jgi:hypothetical protein
MYVVDAAEIVCPPELSNQMLPDCPDVMFVNVRVPLPVGVHLKLLVRSCRMTDRYLL